MLIIGITARGQAGKSTVAKAIAKEAAAKGLNVEIFELSNYVLQEAIGMNTIPPKERSELNPAEVQELVRLGMQRREENPRHWIDLLLKDIQTKKPDVGLIPNLRFLNEAELVRKMDGKIIRVKSYVHDGVEYISPDRDANHISETQQYSINADYFLTTMRGESLLLGRQAATLFGYIWERHLNVN